MKDVAMFTRVTPNQRVSALKSFLDNIRRNAEAKQMLADWGLKVADAAADVMARVIDPETVAFGGDVKAKVDGADWNNIVTRNKMLTPVHLQRWILFYTKRDEP